MTQSVDFRPLQRAHVVLLFALELVGHRQLPQGASAQVASVEVAHGQSCAAFRIARIMTGVLDGVTVSRIDIEVIEALKSPQTVWQDALGQRTKLTVEFAIQAEPPVAFESLEEVRIVRAELRSMGGESLQKARPELWVSRQRAKPKASQQESESSGHLRELSQSSIRGRTGAMSWEKTGEDMSIIVIKSPTSRTSKSKGKMPQNGIFRGTQHNVTPILNQLFRRDKQTSPRPAQGPGYPRLNQKIPGIFGHRCLVVIFFPSEPACEKCGLGNQTPLQAYRPAPHSTVKKAKCLKSAA